MKKENADSKTELVSAMSHELKNFLNIMMAACTMAKSHIDERERVLSYLNTINSAVDRITILVDDILDISRAEHGDMCITEVPFSIDDLVEELNRLLLPLAVDKNLILSISSDLFINREVIGDYDRLLQVLVNLAVNSIKYTPSGGNVVLCFEEIDNSDDDTVSARIVCDDDGIGISEDFLKHIFEPFARADDERVRKIKGNGLGMAIVKETIDAMGGNIHIESMMDAGTTVTIQLKLRKNMRKG